MWSEILTKPLQGAKFCEMRTHLKYCPIDYYEQSTTEHITMENQTPDISSQRCIGTSTNVKHMPADRQISDKHMAVLKQHMHWKTPVNNIDDQWHQNVDHFSKLTSDDNV